MLKRFEINTGMEPNICCRLHTATTTSRAHSCRNDRCGFVFRGERRVMEFVYVYIHSIPSLTGRNDRSRLAGNRNPRPTQVLPLPPPPHAKAKNSTSEDDDEGPLAIPSPHKTLMYHRPPPYALAFADLVNTSEVRTVCLPNASFSDELLPTYAPHF